MGFNISGLVINKNYQENFDQLQSKLGWNLTKGEEIDFETASSNWKEEEYYDVYFSKSGTLVFLNMDLCTSSYKLENHNTLTFAISETSMAFNLHYCENGVEKRTIMEVEGNRIDDSGDKLLVEEKSNDTSEIIWNQFEVVLGKKFWEIENSEKAFRYYFTNNEKIDQSIENPTVNKYDFKLPIQESIFSKNYSDKDLIDKFDEQILFAKANDINIFLYPWSHGDNSSRFMNFYYLIQEINKRPTLLNKVLISLPNKDRFKMLCRINPDDVKENDNLAMIRFIQNVKTVSSLDNLTSNTNSEKKWWEFWK